MTNMWHAQREKQLATVFPTLTLGLLDSNSRAGRISSAPSLLDGVAY